MTGRILKGILAALAYDEPRDLPTGKEIALIVGETLGKAIELAILCVSHVLFPSETILPFEDKHRRKSVQRVRELAVAIRLGEGLQNVTRAEWERGARMRATA